MSKSNPKAAIAAVFPEKIAVGNGVEVYPLTLAHYALLEKINSFLVNGDHEPDSIETVETYYICTHDAAEVFGDFSNIGAKAMEWSATLPPYMANLISAGIKRQIDLMSKAIPALDDKKKLTGAMAS
jgi:hypothetical protein